MSAAHYDYSARLESAIKHFSYLIEERIQNVKEITLKQNPWFCLDAIGLFIAHYKVIYRKITYVCVIYTLKTSSLRDALTQLQLKGIQVSC